MILRRRNHQPYAGAIADAIDVDRAAVCPGDLTDDGQPETGVSGSHRDVLQRMPSPSSVTVTTALPAAAADSDVDVTGAVTQRVVDEVRQRAVEPGDVALDLDGSWRGQLDGPVAGGRPEPLHDARCQGHQVDRTGLDRQDGVPGPGAVEEILGQGDQAADLVVDGVQGAASSSSGVRGRASASSTSVSIRASGVRRSWLASATNLRSRCRPSSSRSIMALRVSASRRSSSSAAGHREPLAGAACGDRGRAGAHPLDRSQPRAGDEVAESARHGQREWPGDQQLVAQSGEGLVRVLARRADHQEALVDRPDQQHEPLLLRILLSRGRGVVIEDGDRLLEPAAPIGCPELRGIEKRVRDQAGGGPYVAPLR